MTPLAFEAREGMTTVVGWENDPPLAFGAREGVTRVVGRENDPPLAFEARERWREWWAQRTALQSAQSWGEGVVVGRRPV